MSATHRALSERWRKDLELIASLYGLTLEKLQGKGRFARHVRARRDCYAYLREQGWSLPQIGGLFGRDHTTIMYALYPQVRAERKRENSRRSAAKLLGARRVA